MDISTQTCITAKRFGLAEAVRMIAMAGFDAVDVSMFDDEQNAWMFADGFEEKIEDAKKTAEELGVYFNQAHAPFPTMKWDDEKYNEMIRPKVIRSIEIAGMLGVKNIVVHPVVFPENQKENNLKMYNELLPYAKKANVKIALENMWGRDKRRGGIIPNVCSVADELVDYCDSLDPEWFTVCLDIGHIGLVGEYEDAFIRSLGGYRLTCLHVHDNDYVHDSHTAPFMMKLPWDDICKALADISYSGELTLEADEFLAHLPDELFASGLEFMFASAQCLANKIEKFSENT